MAAELERFIADQLARLPTDHPDRRFLAGLRQAASAYAEHPPPDPIAAAVDTPLVESGTATATPTIVPEQPPPPVPAMADPEADGLGQVEQERVTLTGRMGARVRYSTTPRGVRRAEFNLAVHADDDATTWHRVLAFRKRAEALEQANPQKGQEAEVIGYRHVQERPDRDGTLRTVAHIVAAHIRLR
ncbi:MAG TPA: single-stranded DNA-binding protein [Chloroflexota bacterium]|nr:single-stranded DNA-binding protein [Chloroflexota bacterium]